eukprot:6319972-Alexandrium_andersonii.AAC.1
MCIRDREFLQLFARFMFSANKMRAAPGFFQKLSVLDAKQQGLRMCLMAAQISSDRKGEKDIKETGRACRASRSEP